MEINIWRSPSGPRLLASFPIPRENRGHGFAGGFAGELGVHGFGCLVARLGLEHGLLKRPKGLSGMYV